MKFIIIVIIVLASYPLFSNDSILPKHHDVTQLILEPIPYTKELYINANVSIPNDHKVKGMPSNINVYEQIDGQWKKTSSLVANNITKVMTHNTLNISGKVTLQSESSPVAIDSTIYHCGKYCVINNFQGTTSRSKTQHSKNLSIKMKGYLPTDKMTAQ